jgi:hypothetical protein
MFCGTKNIVPRCIELNHLLHAVFPHFPCGRIHTSRFSTSVFHQTCACQRGSSIPLAAVGKRMHAFETVDPFSEFGSIASSALSFFRSHLNSEDIALMLDSHIFFVPSVPVFRFAKPICLRIMYAEQTASKGRY